MNPRRRFLAMLAGLLASMFGCWGRPLRKRAEWKTVPDNRVRPGHATLTMKDKYGTITIVPITSWTINSK